LKTGPKSTLLLGLDLEAIRETAVENERENRGAVLASLRNKSGTLTNKNRRGE